MAGRFDPLANPFGPPPPIDPRKTYQPLTVRERMALDRAPKMGGPGTRVTVRSYDIPDLPLSQEHMYVEYDDGREQLIARGGPSAEGRAFMSQALAGRLQVTGGVTPAKLNRDYGKGQRVLFQGFLPEVTAQQAAEPARRNAQALKDRPRRYGWLSNSNSYAADAVEPLFGVRPGDGVMTPGAAHRLAGAQPISPWLVGANPKR